MLILYVFVFILILFIILLIFHIFFLKKEIRNINYQLKRLMNEESNSLINKLYIDKDLEELIKTQNMFIVQKKAIERKNIASNELLKSTILNMSHDIRTPLTSIQGYLQLIDMNEITVDKRKEYIKIITNRINSLKNMMESFFELAKVESNTFPIHLEAVNLHEILVDSLGLYYDLFNENSIEMTLDLDSNVFMLADIKAMKRVFDNLISNIVKHHASYAKISSYKKDGNIYIVFKNDTCNINEKNIDKIFDKFFTVSNSRTEKNSGLGLTITKELVQKMNGKISADYYDEEISFKLQFELYDQKKYDYRE